MIHSNPFDFTDDWSPAEILAAYDFCRMMSEMLWLEQEQVILDELIRRDPTWKDHVMTNLELPFDDEMPV